MNSRRLGRLLTLVLMASLPMSALWANPRFVIDDYVLPPDAEVAGRDIPTLANEWWIWTESVPASRNPVRDRVGTNCAAGQNGPVWNLAGGYGSSRINRTCTIPAGKHLFFPVINMLYYPSPGRTMTCADAKAFAARNNNDFVQLRVSLNDSLLDDPERFRAASAECFDLLSGVPESYGAPVVWPSATDGFWILLEPLPPGTHQLEFQAFYTNHGAAYGDMVQNITYELTVLPK